MNTDQLKSFIQVAENLNFARAGVPQARDSGIPAGGRR